ncbi:MAG: DNA polymerase III subunit [Dehalococcoidia bacterium]|nr:DNA polymerase III subunit [Dehalococcoidia bacterium]
MWQVIGQDKILTLLDNSLKQNSLAHAYILLGAPHIGKMTLAINIAQALNCDDTKPPCGKCQSCRHIATGKHADVTCVTLDSKLTSRTEIGIDTIKELQRTANLPPYEGKCKVLIIYEAEYLSTEASNRLLKILEEPPQNVVWLLLSAEEPRLLPTIISRCQRLVLKPVPPEQIQKLLTDSNGIKASKAKLLSRLCQGCPGWALSAAADDDLLQQRKKRIDKIKSLVEGTLTQRFTYAQQLGSIFSKDRRAAMKIMDTWLTWWHDLMLIKGGYEEAITNVDYGATLKKQAKELSLNQIKEFLVNLFQTQKAISMNVNARLALESLMLNLPTKSTITDKV